MIPKQYGLCLLIAMMGAVTITSIVRRGRRPTDKEIYDLGKSVLGVASSLAVIGWVVYHAAEVSDFAYVLVVGMLPYAWSSLCTAFDTVRSMWTKEVQAIAPEEKRVAERRNEEGILVEADVVEIEEREIEAMRRR
jgi:hypothetical protein